MTTLTINKRSGTTLRLPPWLDYCLFWVPNSHKPGPLGFLLYLVRATIWPMALSFVVLAPFSSRLSSHPLLGLSVMLAFAVLTEECGRYGFARSADNPFRALVIFTTLVIAVETAVYWRANASWLVNLGLRAPSMAVHVLASAALLYGLRHRRRLLPIMAAVYVAHLSFDIGSVALFGDHLAHSQALGGVSHMPASAR